MQVIIQIDNATDFVDLRHKPCRSLLATFEQQTFKTGRGAFWLFCDNCGERTVFLQSLSKICDKVQGQDLSKPVEIDCI